MRLITTGSSMLAILATGGVLALMVTLAWLYIQMLQLLASARR